MHANYWDRIGQKQSNLYKLFISNEFLFIYGCLSLYILMNFHELKQLINCIQPADARNVNVALWWMLTIFNTFIGFFPFTALLTSSVSHFHVVNAFDVFIIRSKPARDFTVLNVIRNVKSIEYNVLLSSHWTFFCAIKSKKQKNKNNAHLY